MTIDQWRLNRRLTTNDCAGIVLLAGAIVPGKYLRGTPISRRECDELLRILPRNVPFLLGGWAIRGWRQSGWAPLRANLFCALQDTDATLHHFLQTGKFEQRRRSGEQWQNWALLGAGSKAVRDHPDLVSTTCGEEVEGPLTYEVEVYQGCVRYRRGCKFCIEPKKGVPIFRTPDEVVSEVEAALDNGVRNIRLGGMTDVYTYMADGVTELEYPIPDPEPIAKLLYGLRDDERIDVLHVDNANPSIIAENLEVASEVTRTLCETLSDGGVLSLGLESADPHVHEQNWLNCDTGQLKVAVEHINEFGRERGERGLPKLLPGLNFIAGLRGESEETWSHNRRLLSELIESRTWLRRINIRQVEGVGFQEVDPDEFASFKSWVRDEVDRPLLEEMFPLGLRLREVVWESHDDRIRMPSDITDDSHRSAACRGKPGITFGRQIGAYPILIGVPYHLPLESRDDVIVTGWGNRSLSAVEAEINFDTASEKQLSAIPGIGEKSAWRLVSERAKRRNRGVSPLSVDEAFNDINLNAPPLALKILRGAE